MEALGLGARLLGAACVVATLLPLLRARVWWVRIWDFPRIQVAVVSLVAVAGMVWAGPGEPAGWLLVAAAGLAAGCQVAVVLPYTLLWPVQSVRGRHPSAGETLRLLVVNVLMTNRTVDGLLGSVREADPDVILAVETDAWWAGRLMAAFGESHPHEVEHPLDNTYGLVLRSRLPLVEPVVRHLLHASIPSVRSGIRLRSGAVVRFYAVHPEPPSPTEAESSLGRDAELVTLGREIAMRTGPTIVAGDLNDVAWSRTSRLFRRLSRLLDPRVGRGLFPTYHAGWWPMRWPLDHVFHSEDFLLREMRRLPAFGSDHFPILIALEHAPVAGAAVQDAPGADAADEEEARETVEEARVVAARGELAPTR